MGVVFPVLIGSLFPTDNNQFCKSVSSVDCRGSIQISHIMFCICTNLWSASRKSNNT